MRVGGQPPVRAAPDLRLGLAGGPRQGGAGGVQGAEDALTAYTAGSAYVNHPDGTGRVAVGALADLVVLDRDPFAGPPEALAGTRVALTCVGGRPVYRAG